MSGASFTVRNAFFSCEKVSGCPSYVSLDLEVQNIYFAVIFVNSSAYFVFFCIKVLFICQIYTLFSVDSLCCASHAISANQKQEKRIVLLRMLFPRVFVRSREIKNREKIDSCQ